LSIFAYEWRSSTLSCLPVGLRPVAVPRLVSESPVACILSRACLEHERAVRILYKAGPKSWILTAVYPALEMSSLHHQTPSTSLPSFGELLDSLKETGEGVYNTSSRRRSVCISSPAMPSSQLESGFALVVSAAPHEPRSFAHSNAQLASTLPRRSRGVRYQPYLTSGPVGKICPTPCTCPHRGVLDT
jgi:hypothetical protein